MSDVIYLRPIDPPIVPEDVRAMAQHAGGCFDLHRVDWKQSFLAADGARMLCWYSAPDAESARLALRQLGSDMNAVWPGSLIGDGLRPGMESDVRAVAEVALEEPFADDELRHRTATLRQRGAPALAGGFVSIRGTKLVYLFRSNDAGAIEPALEDAGLTAQRVWACVPVTPFPDR